MELLPGAETSTSPAFTAGILAGAPLLVHDGHGTYRFESSDRVLYADKSGTRERLGTPPDLWTFILEATPSPGVRSPHSWASAYWRTRLPGHRNRVTFASTERGSKSFEQGSGNSVRTSLRGLERSGRKSVFKFRTRGACARS